MTKTGGEPDVTGLLRAWSAGDSVAGEQAIATGQLSTSIEAIISQRLALARDGSRRAAVEILRGGPVTAKFIQEHRLHELSDYIGTGEGGMQRFDTHLVALYNEGVLSGTEAMRLATNPEAVALGLRGIRRTQAG